MPDIARPLQAFANVHSLKPAACYFGLVFGTVYLPALVLFALMPATLGRLQARIAELDIESHEDEFTYWRKFDRARKGK